jgi:hypothetical protein
MAMDGDGFSRKVSKTTGGLRVPLGFAFIEDSAHPSATGFAGRVGSLSLQPDCRHGMGKTAEGSLSLRFAGSPQLPLPATSSTYQSRPEARHSKNENTRFGSSGCLGNFTSSSSLKFKV